MFRFLLFSILVAVLFCFCTGCTTYWYQEGKTFEECKQDRLECYEHMKKYSADPENLGKYEFKVMEDCMTQTGYRLVTERNLHVRVKREDPELDVYWMTHGVAGFIRQQE